MSSNNKNKTVAVPANGQDNAQSVQDAIAGALSLPAANNQQNTQNETLSLAGGSLLTLPGSSNASMNRRQPKNLQSLLKFAMEATRAEDPSGTADRAPLDDQRRIFLEEALMSLTVNVTDVLDNAIKVLTNREVLDSIKEGDALPDAVRNSFTILLDHVDDLDVANDFYKMGGFAMFPMCYSSQNEKLRARASSVLGTACQNNPFCQEKALNSGLLPVLLNLLQTEQRTALSKCLYALSCMSRGYDPASLELIKLGGCPILVDILTSQEPSAKTKAAFLIRHFCQNYVDSKKQFIKHNVVKLIAADLQAGRNDSTEHLLSILQVLVSTKDPVILRLCRDPRYSLKTVLQDHLKRPELIDDRFVEEKEYCRELLTTIFDTPNIINMSNNASIREVNMEQADR